MFARPVVFAALSLTLTGGVVVNAPRATKYRVDTK